MVFDWFKVDPQNGMDGTTAIGMSVLSVNEGIDRQKVIRAVCGSSSVSMTVRQSGMREVFQVVDGDFLMVDGETFNVLKNE